MKITHILDTFDGGIGSVVRALCEHIDGCNAITQRASGANAILNIPSFLNKLKSDNADLWHFHGGWTPHIWPLLFKLNRPTIISPHGMFSQNALSHSSLKKCLAKYLYQKNCFNSANIIHALTDIEASEIRSYSIKAPIAVIANGIDFSEPKVDMQYLSHLKSIISGRRAILSLSRLHPQKNLETLIDAFNSVATSNDILLIAGDGNSDYKSRLLKLANPQNTIFLGELKGAQKQAAFIASDIFALVSLYEGFPVAILEAARAKKPLLISTAIPIDGIESLTSKVATELNEIQKAIKTALNTPKSELVRAGEQIYNHFKEHYTIQTTSDKFTNLYKYLLNKAPKPDFFYE